MRLEERAVDSCPEGVGSLGFTHLDVWIPEKNRQDSVRDEED